MKYNQSVQYDKYNTIHKMTDYILFVAQECNFQTRSILIPANEFLKVRQEDYDLLKKYVTSYTFIIDEKEYRVDNLLLQNIKWEGRYGHHEGHPYSQLCSTLMWYADSADFGQYNDLKDIKWADNTICNLCRGFSHIKNYDQLRNMTEYDGKKINIIDSFLVLELRNGILEMPAFETTKELDMFMHQHYLNMNKK